MTTNELSLTDKLRQKSLREAIADVTTGSNNLKGPLVVEMDPTTACNLACHDCISANLLNQGGISDERIMQLAADFKAIGVRAVVLIGGGEPMAHPKFGELVRFFGEAGIKVGITTNGTLIDKFMDECAEHVSWLRVSVDAGSDEVFQQFRPHASGKSLFGKVIENMKTFAKKKKGKLGYSFLVLSKIDAEGNLERTNASDISRAAELAKQIGCNYFEVKPAFDMMHFLQIQTEEVIRLVDGELASARQFADDKFGVIAPYTLSEALKGAESQVKPYTRCLVSQLRTVVTPTGVYVCPYHRGNLNMRIGDTNKVLLSDIWASKKKESVLARVDPSKHCNFHCIRHESNLFLERVAEGANYEELADFDFFV
jgi:MoaA/NifB/PqqE/SkfB family radical SAM enzyme